MSLIRILRLTLLFSLSSLALAGTDGDGVPDGTDNCPNVANADQLDTDSDGLGNACDDDDDGDGVIDEEDALPIDPFETIDSDGDGVGDNADQDDDNDGVEDEDDAFPLDFTEYLDTDADGTGDSLDTDDDGDARLDDEDNCPLIANAGQQDRDQDGVGDLCDSWPDDDRRSNMCADGQVIVLSSQADVDDFSNTYGNCDVVQQIHIYGSDQPLEPLTNLDGLEAINWVRGQISIHAPQLSDITGLRNLAVASNFLVSSSELSDLVGLESLETVLTLTVVGTNFRSLEGLINLKELGGISVRESSITNLNGISDAQFGFFTTGYYSNGQINFNLEDNLKLENCSVLGPILGWPNYPATKKELSEKRIEVYGFTNNGKVEDWNTCLRQYGEKVTADQDTDGDGLIDSDDEDNDGDGVNDDEDFHPWDSAEQKDTDGDLIGDNADPDDDNDRVPDVDDAFPTDPGEWTDSDQDGVGDFADADDDNDGIPDLEEDSDSDGIPDYWERKYRLDPNSPDDNSSDIDGDGLPLLTEFQIGTNPFEADSDNDSLPDDWELENGRNPTIPDYKVVGGYGTACVLDDRDVTCWGSSNLNVRNYEFPGGQRPHAIAHGIGHLCMASGQQAELVCHFDTQKPADYVVPLLTGVRKLWGIPSLMCALLDSGVECWGENNHKDVWSNVPPFLQGDEQLSLSSSRACTIFEDELFCWGSDIGDWVDPGSYSDWLDSAVNPTEVAVEPYGGCFNDESGISCFGPDPLNTGRLAPPNLKSPRNLVGASGYYCAVDDDEIYCWGDNSEGAGEVEPITSTPKLKNIARVEAIDRHACALADDGVTCWGWNPPNPSLTAVPASILIDPDRDGYSNQNGQDAFPLDPTEHRDFDSDGVGDNSDNCPAIFNSSQKDTDMDGVGNKCDSDIDGDRISNLLDEDDDNDGVLDSEDAFPADDDESLDTDGDGVGNNADNDDDGDGVLDLYDQFPLDSTEVTDADLDGTGDNADPDDDNDGVNDELDAFPLDSSESKDTDNDGVGDNSDAFPSDASESKDTDSDEVGDNGDNCPNLANADQLNTDGDQEGDACDLDDDNDGFTDEEELADGTNPLSRFSCRSGCFSFDVDENLEAQPLTDGLLVIRHLFGFSGDSLISGAVSSDASRDASDTIASYLTDADSQLDIDGDGESKPLTDGLLLIRYLFGFSGDSLISGAIGSGAERDTAEEVEAYILERIPVQ